MLTKTCCFGALFLAKAMLLGISQPTSATDGRFVNLSTRAYVGTGDEVMIGGFIIEGGARQVLIQALGPELTNLGVSNALADPVLRVIDTSDPANQGELMFNDNWEDSQGQLVSDLWGGSPNLTAASLSSAAVLTLEPGNYTAIVEGKNGTAGVAIVEVYEIDLAGADGSFINLSTRAVVRTGDEVMIGGFIISEGARQVAIHALGPELANRGVSHVLADPVLTVFDSTGLELMENDDWEDSQGKLLQDIWGTALPFTPGSKSSAAVLTLEPGNYTAIVEGKNGTSGIALVEVWQVIYEDPQRADREALIALYNATDGANWNKNENWLTDAPLDQWNGVTIDDNGRVIELNLSRIELTGNIPVELGRLTKLEVLDLYGNALTGSIPAELGSLTNLVSLSLGGNDFTGNIPAELGNLINLTGLYLGQSNLTGTIVWGQGGNQLTGTIPAELSNLANLEVLDLSVNQLTGSIPADLSRLTKLKVLDLSVNQLTGGIPAELSNLTNLTRLDLAVNRIDGSIPVELGNLTNLTGLYLEGNALNGPIPASLGSLSNLTRLDLHNNDFTGTIPAELGSLANLKSLRLSRIQLSGSIPTALGSLTNLTDLTLAANQLSGPIPAVLGRLTNLTFLDLSGNELTGSIPAELGNLTNLTRLDLGYNQLTGNIPAGLGSITNLNWLELDYNAGLSGPLPGSFTGLEALQYLFLNGTGLCAPMDEAFQTWLQGIRNKQGVVNCEDPVAEDRAALVALYNATGGPNWTNNTNWLSDRPLGEWYGVATDASGRVSSLRLHAHDGNRPIGSSGLITGNGLRGRLPRELGQLTNLQSLWLADNQLSSSIPAELGNLTNLEELGLLGNQLSALIPEELGNLANLKTIYLGGNQFSGCIPSGLRDVMDNDLSTLGLPYCGDGQIATRTWHDDSFTDSTGRTLLYRYWFRSDWDLTVPRGVVLFLHGNNHGTADRLRQRAWQGLDEALELGLAFIVPASPQSVPEGLSFGERQLVSDPVGRSGTRYWATEDARLIHELLQSNLKSWLALDHDRVIFSGGSQGTCFLAEFVEFYGGSYGGGFHAWCGCIWLDFDGDDARDTSGFNFPVSPWRPSFQWTPFAASTVGDRFKVFVEATTEDRLHSSAVSMSRYYSEWLGLETRTDLESAGGHCSGGATPLKEIYDWLSSSPAPERPGSGEDTDGDGVPDWSDLDDDNDGAPDFIDALPRDPRDWRDTDSDSIADAIDQDADGDGITNAWDAFPLESRDWRDTDGDGIGNMLDDDDDNDGLPDARDQRPLVGTDNRRSLAFVVNRGGNVTGYTSAYFQRRAHVHSDRPAAIIYPAAQGHSQSYQFLELGDSSDARFEIMIDSFVRQESCTDILLPQLCDVGGYDSSGYYSSYFQNQFFRIWVDRNRNRDLTDDGPPLVSALNVERPRTVSTTEAILEVPYASGQVLPYAISVSPGRGTLAEGLAYSGTSVWRGEVEMPSGKRVLAIAVDGNVDGLFNSRSDTGLQRDFVCLDLDGNGWLNECDFSENAAGFRVRGGAILPSEPFDWDGGRYTLSVAPWGREITIVETLRPSGSGGL